MLNNINANYGGHAVIKAYTDRKEALRGADMINAIQVGDTFCTVIDPKCPRNGLQTIADTLGIGGIFRLCAPSRSS